MATSKLKLDKRHKHKDGTYSVAVLVGYGRNMLISTGISVKEEEWDGKKIVGPRSKQLDPIVQAQLTLVRSTILELTATGKLKSISNEDLLATIKGKPLKSEHKPSLGEMLERVIETKRSSSASIMKCTLNRIKKFADPYKVSLDDVTKQWLDEFAESEPSMATNTKITHLQSIRTAMNVAIDNGYTTNYPFRRYRLPRYEPKKRALSVDDMRKLINAKLKRGIQRRYRDTFLLIFCLIGINFADLVRLKSVVNGRVEYRRAKTGKPYSIKVEPEAQALIDRLGDEQGIVPYHNPDRHKDHAKLRYGLLRIAEDLGLPPITTYYARHSWATIAASLDIPKDTIAQALGHDMGNRMTAIYIDYDRSKVDAANRKVLDAVFAKKEPS